MKLLKSILFKFIVIIMVCIVSFNLYNFICLNVLKEDLATINGYAVLEVVSGSMEPTIHVGDMIVIDTKVESYEKDDIITFYDVNGSFVTHRIININGKKMVTQGDNNDSPDEEMSTDNIVGKVVKTIPAAGKILASLKSPLVMILILVIGVLVCFLTSTDDNLIPVDLTDEEKEFLEYKKNKILQAKENNVNFVDYSADKKKKTLAKKAKEKSSKSNSKTKDEDTKTVKKTSKVAGSKKTTDAKKKGTVKKIANKDNVDSTKKAKTSSKSSTIKANKNTKKTKNEAKVAKVSTKATKSAKGTVKKVEKNTTKKETSPKTTTTAKKAVPKTTKKVVSKVESTKVEKKPTKKVTPKKEDVKTVKKSTKKVVGTKKTTKK